jgi:hypothetical protein
MLTANANQPTEEPGLSAPDEVTLRIAEWKPIHRDVKGI